MKRLFTLLVLSLLFASIAEAQTPLRQSTSRVVRICGAVAVGDGFTPVTTVALGTADEAEALRDNTATLDISGATWAAITGADGCYSLTLDTTATNTVGELVIVIQDDSVILPLIRTFQVVEEAVYDRDYAASATGQVTVATNGLPASAIQSNAFTAAKFASDFLTAAKVATDVSTEIWGSAARTLTAATNITSTGGTTVPQTGDAYARLGAPAGASVSADIANVLSTGGTGPWTTGAGGSAPTAADIYAEFISGTNENAFKADVSALATSSALATVDGNVDAILVDTGTDIPARFTGIEGATFSTSTDSLEALRNRGDAAWTTGSGTGLTAIASGTAQSATGTTLVLASGETFANDELSGAVVQITGGSTGVGQTRCISGNVGSTDTITVATWTTTPTGTITYEIVPSLGATCPDDSTTVATAVVDEWETQSQADPTGFHVNVKEVNGTAQTANDNGADINSILADTNELQTDDYPARFTGIEGATFSTSTDSLEAIRNRGDAAWTTGAGGSAPTAADIYAEFISGTNENAFKADVSALATAAALATVDGNVDAILVDTGTTLDGKIDAIKAVTDQFVFTVTGRVDTNVLSMKGTDVCITAGGAFTSENAASCVP